MKFKAIVVTFLVGLLTLLLVVSTQAQRDSLPKGYPDSLQKDLNHLIRQYEGSPKNVNYLVDLGHVYFNLGDDLFEDKQRRLEAFEKGKHMAKKAIELDESNPEAHYVYAMNLGSEAQLKGVTAGVIHLDEILNHVRRTIALKPDHAGALQMLGGLLAELPWFAGGNEKEAKRHLMKAISIDGNYTKARIFLAKLYLREGKNQKAREQLQAVIQADSPHYPYTWRRGYRPEAENLLFSIGK